MDLSREGVGLATPAVLRVGSTHPLRLPLPGLADPVTLDARVVHVHRSGRPGEYEAGLRFGADAEAELKRAVRAAFATRSQARGGPRLELISEASWSEGAQKQAGVVDVLNLGLGGALLRGDSVPSLGAPFILGMRAPGSTQTVALPARVVWSQESGAGVTAGISFISHADTPALVGALLEAFFWTPRAPAPTAGPRPPEPRIGRFEPGELLERGRTLEIYRAKAHTPLDEASGAVDFALRRFFGEEQDVAAWSERFIAAAQIGAELADVPGVLRVYGATSGRDDCLLATEHFEGTSFDQSLALFARTAELPPLAAILEVISEVLRTLQQVHQLGFDDSHPFVHGDLRPANVLLGLGGEVKLTGFGFAPEQPEPRTIRAPPDRLEYLAPELFRDGGSPTRASDVYQCAVMLYEAVTGARPFRPTSEEHLLKLVAAGPLLPSRLNPELPLGLEALLIEALQLEPAARPSVGRFLAGLQAPVGPVTSSTQTDPAGILEKVVQRSSKLHARLPASAWDDRPTDHVGVPELPPAPARAVELPREWKPRRRELEIGQVLGRYRILAKIGQGGMAAVYLARPIGPTDVEPPLVLKTLLPERNAELVNIKLFLNEARVACVLNHANIVQLLDFGFDQGLPFMALEYVEGRTLSQVASALKAQGRRFSPPMAARLIAESCKGLAYAHGLTDAKGHPLGIIHRDMSARNILLSFSGEVKVLDFGIAKFRGSSDLTKKGMVRGTVDYVSPEQFREEAPTPQVDVWAMGVNLYEVLTGTSPFKRDDFSQTMFAITNQEPPAAHDVAADCPLALSAIAHRALQKNPADRFPDAQAMGGQLQFYLGAHPSTAQDLAGLMGTLFRAAPGAERERLARLAWSQDDSQARTETEEHLDLPRLPGATHPEPRHRPLAGGSGESGTEAPTEVALPVHRPQAEGAPSVAAGQSSSVWVSADVPTDAARPVHSLGLARRGWWRLCVVGAGLLVVAALAWRARPTKEPKGPAEGQPTVAQPGGPDAPTASGAALSPAPIRLVDPPGDAGTEAVAQAPLPSAPDAGNLAAGPVVELSCNVPCSATSDGVELGLLPKRLTDLAPGEHLLVFTAKTPFGSATKQAVLTARAGEQTALAMQFGTGLLSVSAPARSAVVVSGQRRGFTPLKGISVIEGTHQVRVGSRRARTVTIVPGQAATLRVR